MESSINVLEFGREEMISKESRMYQLLKETEKWKLIRKDYLQECKKMVETKE